MGVHDAKARRLLSADRDPHPEYPLDFTLSMRQLRQVLSLESAEALELARWGNRMDGYANHRPRSAPVATAWREGDPIVTTDDFAD